MRNSGMGFSLASLGSQISNEWNNYIKKGLGYEAFAMILAGFIIVELIFFHYCCRCCRNRQNRNLEKARYEFGQANVELNSKKREYESEKRKRKFDDDPSKSLHIPKKGSKGSYLDRMIAIYERSKVTGDILLKINKNQVNLNEFEFDESKDDYKESVINNDNNNNNNNDVDTAQTSLLDSQQPGLASSVNRSPKNIDKHKHKKKNKNGKNKNVKNSNYHPPLVPSAPTNDLNESNSPVDSVIAMGSLDNNDQKIYLTTDDGNGNGMIIDASNNDNDNNNNNNSSKKAAKGNKKTKNKIVGLGKTCMKTRSEFLIAASDVFAGMLNPESHFLEFSNKEILLNYCDSITTCDDLCYFLITNELRYDCKALELLRISDCYQIKSLAAACIDRLISQRGLTVKSFVEIVILFEKLSIQKGFEKIVSFAKSHKNEISKDKRFKELPVSFRCGVLGFEDDSKTTSLLFGP